MKAFILPFAFTFLFALLLVPIARSIAFRYQFVDQPNKRKIHKEPIPLLGGVVIFFGYMLASIIWVESLRLKLLILLSGAFIVGIGVLDDYFKTRKKDLPASPKLFVQFLVGIIVFSFGVRIEGITSIFDGQLVHFPPGLSLLVTLIWIIGLINMFNFLDGADGLATGVTLISATTLFLIAFIKVQTEMALMSVILMGVSLGFLKHNFYPAKIFMGDAGSAFLGLVLAIISIEGALKSATLLSIVMMVFVFGVPIFDTLIVLFKRYRQKKPLHMPDKNHAHHRLLNKGYSQKQAVTLIYVVSILFSIISALVLFWFIS